MYYTLHTICNPIYIYKQIHVTHSVHIVCNTHTQRARYHRCVICI